MEITLFEDKYYSECKRICYETANDDYRTCGVLEYMYLDYYLKYEKDTCFVLVDDDKVYGYILCSKNIDLYQDRMKNEYLPKVKENKDKYKELKLDVFISKLLKNKYASHMHIDLDKSVQRKGYGRMLVDRLINKLNSLNINGLYLTCSSKNSGAIKFYSNVGFKKGLSLFVGTFFSWRLKSGVK